MPQYHWLGRQSYAPFLQNMQQRATAIAAAEAGELIWACEHEPVYTTGWRGIDNRSAAVLPAPWLATDRGGQTTFHGPGQLMLYPLISLRQRKISVRHYIAIFEQSVIDLLQQFNLTAYRRCGMAGVWTDEGKIAAIGMRVSNGVAYHGMALNVDADLQYFRVINPCGTGLKAVNLKSYVEVSDSMQQIAGRWQDIFQAAIQSESHGEIGHCP
ncbi:MAG: lipoyl(octanoyl) transferase [Zetaproteobacteria bacterium CG1_02_49_23]|nr:MAG: lipoyl(octanoyl) transferase [Zetaproteobacteria bacterium CG1_02_49_23]